MIMVIITGTGRNIMVQAFRPFSKNRLSCRFLHSSKKSKTKKKYFVWTRHVEWCTQIISVPWRVYRILVHHPTVLRTAGFVKYRKYLSLRDKKIITTYYAPQLYRQVLLSRVLAMGILSVCLSVCLSRPGGIPRPGEIETPGLHHMIA